MTTTITSRHELIGLIGQPVHVQANLARTGQIMGHEETATLLLTQIQLDGVQAPFGHAWVRLGATGSERARRYGDALLHVPLEMEATICAYQDSDHETGLSLGLGAPRGVIAFVGGRWRTIVRSQEPVYADHGERMTQQYIDRIIDDLLIEQQRPIMNELRAYAASHRVDREVQKMLQRFFTHGRACTTGQMRHAAAVLA